MIRTQHKAYFVIELLLLQLIATVLVTYAIGYYLASYHDIPVGLWRIFRGIYIAGFALVFLLSTLNEYGQIKRLFLSGDILNYRSPVLLACLTALGIFSAFSFYRLATPVFSITEYITIIQVLGHNLKIFAGIFATGVIIYALRHLITLHKLILLFPRIIQLMLLLTSLGILTAPILFHGMINSETHFDLNATSNATKEFEKGVGEKINFVLTRQQYYNFIANRDLAINSTFLQLHAPGKEPVRFLHTKSTLEALEALEVYNVEFALWETHTLRPQEICFIKINIPEDGIKSFADCVQSRNIRNLLPNYSTYADHIKGVNRFNSNNSNQDTWNPINQTYGTDTVETYLKASQRFFSNAQNNPKKFKDIRRYVGNASSTGFYTHHYAAITHTIDNAPNTVALGANQYGFGPLIIAKTLKIFGLSSYDGIYIGTILANFILGFVLIFLFRSASVPCQVLVGTGFILSISVSFLLNHMFAPMVYTIRYLPSLVLFSYLAFKALQTKPNQNFFSENLTHSLFALFIATYNFEYGILTILAMILVSILHGRIGLSVIYVIAIFTTIAFKAWAGGYETGSSGVNYVGYFSNFWAAGIYDRVLKFITIAAFIPVGWYLVTRTRANKSLEKDSLIILFFLLSIKAGFVGSGNHAGPIFLLVALLSIVFLMQSRTLKTFELRDAAAYTTVAICTLPLLLILLGGRHGLETKLSFETYSKTAISQFQPMSNGLRKKLELSKNIMEKGDIFISPSDSAISLFTQQKITKPFFDLSTNILEKTSYLQIEKSYLDSRAIVVDRLISDSGYRSRNIKTLRSMTVHDHIAPKYWSVIDKFIILWKRIKLQRKDELKLCGENFYFQRYCFKKD